MTKYRCLTFAVLMMLALPAWSGAICVVALWKGSVLDYVLLSGKEHPFELQEKAEIMLAEKGYDYYDRGLDIRHPRGQTFHNSGFAVVLESRYIPKFRKIDKERRSIGCGFSGKSYNDALWDAIRDMQTHDWSWVPDRDGYEVIEKIRF